MSAEDKNMNNPNPFHPQVSLLEQKNKKRARVKVAVYSIFACNVLLISPLLIQGCRDKQPVDKTDTSATAPTNSDTTSNSTVDNSSNAAPLLPTPATNPVVPPTPVVNQPPPIVATSTEYVIVKGDSFSKIAHTHGVSVKALEDANPGLDAAKLQIGKKIQIPAATAAVANSTSSPGSVADSGDTYVVKSGDSLSKIAHEHSTTVKALKAANDLKTNKIIVGQKLKLPAPGSAAPVETTPVTPPSTSSVSPTTPLPATNGTGH